MTTTVCSGSGGTLFEARKRGDGTLLGKCPRCRRVFFPTAGGKLRRHVPRSAKTASADRRMEAIWQYTPAGYLVDRSQGPSGRVHGI